MSPTNLTKAQLKSFNEDGYIIVKDFCSKKEIKRLYEAALGDSAEINDDRSNIDLRSSTRFRQQYWYNLVDDVFSYLSRSEKIVNSVAQLLDRNSPVCHIKTNLIQKEPNIGGVWQWHQDFSYWHKNHFLFPDQMVSVMVALTDINKESGCSQLLKGSHKLGRINHCFEGQRAGADKDVVNMSLRQMELIYAELAAGDAIFFHSNLLHRSDANLSGHSFWSLLSCYSSKSNVPCSKNIKSWHSPVDIVPNCAIMEWESRPVEVTFSHNELLKSGKPSLLMQISIEPSVKLV